LVYKSRKIKEQIISSVLYALSGLRYCIDVGRISEFPRSSLLTPSRPVILAKLSESLLVDVHLQCFYFLWYYHILTKPLRSLSLGIRWRYRQVLLAQVTKPRIDFSVLVRGKPAMESAGVSPLVAILCLDALPVTGTC
jgi:hypothetical protein